MAGPATLRHSSSLHALTLDKTRSIRTALLDWYAKEARQLPWRLPPVAFGAAPYEQYIDRLYRCLLSETMLQQTQVKTVLPFYEKWLKKFPTIVDLSNAPEEEVMAAWAGLGYYSRAKRLHQAAKHLVKEHIDGEVKVPTEPEYWIKNVPGVGPYTAGAIISISFDVSAPIVDGNVQRVLSRLLAIHGDTSTPKSQGSRLIWERATELAKCEHPGEFNQSLMELGATVCTPVAPNCTRCPLNKQCEAFKQLLSLKRERKDVFAKARNGKSAIQPSVSVEIENFCTVCPGSIDASVLPEKPEAYIQSLYPFKPAKKAQREENAIVLVIMRKHEVYLEKKEKGLLAGLYDFPTQLLSTDEDLESLLDERKRLLRATLSGTTMHLFTHIRRTSHVLKSDEKHAISALDDLKRKNITGKWVAIDQVPDIGVSELCLKNLRLATGSEGSSKRKAFSKPIKGSVKDVKKRKMLSDRTSEFF